MFDERLLCFDERTKSFDLESVIFTLFPVSGEKRPNPGSIGQQ